MEQENIYDGDYVIVQRFGEAESPKQGELIVTRYLHIDDEKYVDLNYPFEDERLEGPTVKYFYQLDG